MVWDASYEAYGKLVHENGTVTFPAPFTGKQVDSDTGLYYFNARWYDAELGRFVTEDPAQDGTNWYEYCLNNPLAYTDPLGLEVTYDMQGRHDSGAEEGSREGPEESKGGKGPSEAGARSDGKNEIEIKQGTFKDPWPVWAKRIDQGLTKFLARNFLGVRPDGYVRTVEGTIIPMSESGTSFAYSERVTDADFFLVTAFAGVFNLAKTSVLPVAGQLESGKAGAASELGESVVPNPGTTILGNEGQILLVKLRLMVLKE